MATIITDGELLRRAVKELDRLMRETPDASFCSLLDRVAMQFNLGPGAAADLERLFNQHCKKNEGH